LDTKFFLFKAAQIGRSWKSLTVLRLGIVHDERSRGIQDLKLVLEELTNLRQLHLSSVGPCLTSLDLLIDTRVAWNGLTDLTLQRFEVGESTLRELLDIPSMESVSLRNIALQGDGCRIRIRTSLGKKRFERVYLFGWLVNITTDEGWGGDSNEDGSLLKEVTEWLMTDVENKGECPLTTENIESM
jgi:hypothetical protein